MTVSRLAVYDGSWRDTSGMLAHWSLPCRIVVSNGIKNSGQKSVPDLLYYGRGPRIWNNVVVILTRRTHTKPF